MMTLSIIALAWAYVWLRLRPHRLALETQTRRAKRAEELTRILLGWGADDVKLLQLRNAMETPAFVPPRLDDNFRTFGLRVVVESLKEFAKPAPNYMMVDLGSVIVTVRHSFGKTPERLVAELAKEVERLRARQPVPMLLFCPRCLAQHIDAPQPEKDWTNPPHRSHECQDCGHVWRPADVPTTGVATIATMGKRDGQAAPTVHGIARVARELAKRGPSVAP